MNNILLNWQIWSHFPQILVLYLDVIFSKSIPLMACFVIFTFRDDSETAFWRFSANKVVFKNIAKFTGKYLCCCFLQVLGLEFDQKIFKRRCFLWILRSFSEHLFCRTSTNGCFCSGDQTLFHLHVLCVL